jgi:beta-galactosidase
VDLAGFPKDAYFMYQSEWTDTPVLHIFPHWNWNEGQVIDVWAYTNCEEVELFLNGESKGTRKKVGDDLHVFWRLPFAAGTLKAVGRNIEKDPLIREIKTAGPPARIVVQADRNPIVADGKDLAFVTVKVLDENGTPAPRADNLIKFDITGEGTIAGVDNGLQTSMEPFRGNTRRAFNGLCLVVIRSSKKAGSVSLKATSDGLEGSEIVVTTR